MTWYRRSGAGRSLRRCSPRSFTLAPDGIARLTSARVASDARIWPPRAADMIRAARWISMPTYPPAASAASPVWMPMRTLTTAPRGHGSVAMARWIRMAAPTASPAVPKHPEERVTLGADLGAGAGKGCSDELVVPREQRAVVGPELLDEPRRALDVGEHERGGPGRQLGHSPISVRPPPFVGKRPAEGARLGARRRLVHCRPRRHSSAVEQLFRKQQVLGSNPSVGSIPPSRVRVGLLSGDSTALALRRIDGKTC